MSCPICIEPAKTQITCFIASCNYTACKSCISQYLLSTYNEPHCMNCRNKWGFEFLKTNLGNTFVNQTYRKHRMGILADSLIAKKESYIDKSILFKENREDKETALILYKKVAELRQQYKSTLNEYKNVNYRIHQRNALLKSEEPKPTVAKTKKFIMSCQNNACRGMLDATYYCNLCAKSTCKSCLEVKQPNHECNKDNIASANLIREQTRPCPKCNERISRIDGCDQMWCTACNTAFSWNKGIIETGPVHNPHYFQWLRAGNANIHFQNICNNGNIANFNNTKVNKICVLYSYEQFISNNYEHLSNNQIQAFEKIKINAAEYLDAAKQSIEFRNKIYKINEYIIHVNQVSVRDLRTKIANLQKTQVSIYGYILGELSREELGSSLVTNEMSIIKHNAHLDILTAAVLVCSDILRSLDTELNNIQNLDIIIHNQLSSVYIGYRQKYQSLNKNDILNKYDEFVKFMPKLIETKHISAFQSVCEVLEKHINSIEKYLAYSNSELIKILALYDSKKTLELWDKNAGNKIIVNYKNKAEIANDIAKYEALCK